MLRNQKGITLVALVITIIVLLILAGVTISMVLGQNGILSQANQAKAENQLATIEEQVQMAVFAQTSQFLQNNVLAEGNTGAEALVDDVVAAVGNTGSKLCTSLPEGYSVKDAAEDGSTTKAKFTVTVNGTDYTAKFDGVAQSTTVEIPQPQDND